MNYVQDRVRKLLFMKQHIPLNLSRTANVSVTQTPVTKTGHHKMLVLEIPFATFTVLDRASPGCHTTYEYNLHLH